MDARQASAKCAKFALSLNLASFCRHARAPQRAALSGAGGYGGNAARTRQRSSCRSYSAIGHERTER